VAGQKFSRPLQGIPFDLGEPAAEAGHHGDAVCGEALVRLASPLFFFNQRHLQHFLGVFDFSPICAVAHPEGLGGASAGLARMNLFQQRHPAQTEENTILGLQL
jgi:hypothetical protein